MSVGPASDVVCQAVIGSTWAVAISRHFFIHRARAFGVTMIGSSAASLGMPLLSNYLIEHYGWRTAYLSIGIGWGVPHFRSVYCCRLT